MAGKRKKFQIADYIKKIFKKDIRKLTMERKMYIQIISQKFDMKIIVCKDKFPNLQR